jgi:hypothetical protein
VGATAALVIIPDALGTRVLGQTWATAITAVPYIGLECAANCWIVGLYSWLQAQGMGRRLFRLRVGQVSLQLSAAAAAAFFSGSVVVIAAALAVSCWVMALIGLAVVGRAALDPHTPEPGSGDKSATPTPPDQPWPTIDVLADEVARSPVRNI